MLTANVSTVISSQYMRQAPHLNSLDVVRLQLQLFPAHIVSKIFFAIDLKGFLALSLLASLYSHSYIWLFIQFSFWYHVILLNISHFDTPSLWSLIKLIPQKSWARCKTSFYSSLHQLFSREDYTGALWKLSTILQRLEELQLEVISWLAELYFTSDLQIVAYVWSRSIWFDLYFDFDFDDWSRQILR